MRVSTLAPDLFEPPTTVEPTMPRPSARSTATSAVAGVIAATIGALVLAACAGDDAAGHDDDTGHRSDTVGQAAFCELAPDPDDRVPADHVGSPEHVTDLRALRDAAPPDLVDDLELVAAHFDDGVDPADPDSQLVFNFPDDVTAAIGRITASIDEHCTDGPG